MERTHDLSDARAAEHALALSYAPPGGRPALMALFSLDDRLAAIVRAAREPIVGQMRLTWWYEALEALDTAAPPAEPVLQALHATVVPAGVTGARLAVMIDGWEALLDPEPLGADAMAGYAAARGGTLFGAGTRVCGADEALARMAGEGWALADLARHAGDAGERATAAALARARLGEALATRWPRHARALGAMAHAARMDVAEPRVPAGSPRRVARLLRHRLTGG